MRKEQREQLQASWCWSTGHPVACGLPSSPRPHSTRRASKWVARCRYWTRHTTRAACCLACRFSTCQPLQEHRHCANLRAPRARHAGGGRALNALARSTRLFRSFSQSLLEDRGVQRGLREVFLLVCWAPPCLLQVLVKSARSPGAAGDERTRQREPPICRTDLEVFGGLALTASRSGR